MSSISKANAAPHREHQWMWGSMSKGLAFSDDGNYLAVIPQKTDRIWRKATRSTMITALLVVFQRQRDYAHESGRGQDRAMAAGRSAWSHDGKTLLAQSMVG